MKRLIVGVLALTAIVIPVASNASATGPKPAALKKVVITSVNGQQVFPNCADLCGKAEITFVIPAGGVVDHFVATCVSKTTGVVGSISRTFHVDFPDYSTGHATTAPSEPSNASGDYASDGSSITLRMQKYPGGLYPTLSCSVDSYGDGVVSKAGPAVGKAPKVPASLSADCAHAGPAGTDLTDDSGGFPADDHIALRNPLHSSLATGGNTLYLGVTLPGLGFAFCSTDAAHPGVPKFLTDQETDFTGSAKVNQKAGTATLKKLKLVSPVSSSIPLLVSGATLVYHYDPAKLSIASDGCIVADATTDACDTSVPGTITATSTAVKLVKVGKPIVSAPLTLNFTYAPGLPGTKTADITFEKAQTDITIGTVTVSILVQPTGVTFADPAHGHQATWPSVYVDHNIGAPIWTFAALPN